MWFSIQRSPGLPLRVANVSSAPWAPNGRALIAAIEASSSVTVAGAIGALVSHCSAETKTGCCECRRSARRSIELWRRGQSGRGPRAYSVVLLCRGYRPGGISRIISSDWGWRFWPSKRVLGDDSRPSAEGPTGPPGADLRSRPSYRVRPFSINESDSLCYRSSLIQPAGFAIH